LRKVALLTLLALLVAASLVSREEGRGVVITGSVTYTITGGFLLKNECNTTVRDYVYVSLPQNTSYQRSYVASMTPPPARYVVDEDGNAYAVVFLEALPGRKYWINVTYRVEVYSYYINESESRGTWPTYELVRKYTTTSGYWNIYNLTLIKLAREIAYANTPLEAVTRLARWVSTRVNYQVYLGRAGSDHAVTRTWRGYAITGDCVEVADVFVAMARILGIPSRTVFGILLERYEQDMWLNYSTIEAEGEYILTHWGGHMWPQVYVDPYGWIDVDMLDGMAPNVGIYSARHIVFGVEETKYYGSALSSTAIPSYLTLEYAEYHFRGG
jgi:transglutaminase-like putative cysteine protease